MSGAVEPAGRPDYARPGSEVVVAHVTADGRAVEGAPAKPDRWLTGNEVAELLNLSPSTFRNYVAIGRAPKADEPDADTPQNRRRPLWLLSSINRWRDSPSERAIRRRKSKRQREAGAE